MTPIEFGVNHDPANLTYADVTPADMLGPGCPWLRAVLRREGHGGELVKAFLTQGHRDGAKNLGIIARESVEGFASDEEAAAYYSTYYAGLVDAWQIGNEPDHVSESSETLDHAEINARGRAFRTALPDAFLVLGGLVSGHEWYLRGVDLSLFNAIAVHPYGQRPDGWPESWGFGWLRDLVARYRALLDELGFAHVLIWITEFGGTCPVDLPEWKSQGVFRNEIERNNYHVLFAETAASSGVAVCIVFAFHDGVAGYGLRDAAGQPRPVYFGWYAACERLGVSRENVVTPPGVIPTIEGGSMNLEELLAKHELKTWPTGTGADVEHGGNDLVPIRKAMVNTAMDVWVEERAGYATFVHGSNSPKA